jgi:hypothetical protein
MVKDEVASIAIDDQGRLRVSPLSASFPYIYREAMEVGWDASGKFLFSPSPREWSYGQWFQQIVAATKEQGYELVLSAATAWENVPDTVRQEITASIGEANV